MLLAGGWGAKQQNPYGSRLPPLRHCSDLLSFITHRKWPMYLQDRRSNKLFFKSRKTVKWLQPVGHLVYTIASLRKARGRVT